MEQLQLNEHNKTEYPPMHTCELDVSATNLFKDCNNNCPCFYLLSEERKKQIIKWLLTLNKNISKIKDVRLILLGESMPNGRYFYDINTDYSSNGFRYELCTRLELKTDVELFSFLQKKGIIVLDCAFCPLHLIKDKKVQRHSATHCFKRHAAKFIEKHPNVPIFTFFPAKRGLLKQELPTDISKRINEEASFTNIQPIIEFIKNMK